MSELDDHRARRLDLRKTENWIVDPIWPNGALHAIMGPPDIGKTSWFLPVIKTIAEGGLVFGKFQSYPQKYIYLTLDRSLRDTDRTLRRLGLDDWNIPAYSIEEVMPRSQASKKIELEPDIFEIFRRFPDVKLFFIEGLQGLLPNQGRGQSLNKAQMLWVIRLRDAALNHGITIIAVNHTPKASDAVHDRENMLGSQGLIGGLGTVIMFDLPPAPFINGQGGKRGMAGRQQTNERLVTIMPKNSPKLFAAYTQGHNGIFELNSLSSSSPYLDTTGSGDADDPIVIQGRQTEVFATSSDHTRVLDAFLREAPETLFTMNDFKAWGDRTGASHSSLLAWFSERLAAGKLLAAGAGKYSRGSVN